MSILFKPTGSLDISTDAATIPDGDMTRCKNLTLTQSGVLKTRYGYSILQPVIYQDYTKFTQYEIPPNNVSISENTVTLTSVPFPLDAYIYKDFGESFFSGDYEVKLQINISACPSVTIGFLWGLSNVVANLATSLISPYEPRGCHFLMLAASGASEPNYGINFNEMIGGVQTDTDMIILSKNITYYITIIRDVSVGTYGTAYLNVYSDAARTVLVATKNVALTKSLSFRYLYGWSGYPIDIGYASGLTGTIANLKLDTTLPIYEIVQVTTSSTRYSFAGNEINTNSYAIASGLTSAKWSTILYNQYNSKIESIFGINGYDRKRIEGDTVFEWGVDAPTERAKLAAGSATGLTGDYKVKYTYARKIDGLVVLESNPSNESLSITLVNNALDITLTAPTDPQITHYRIYRTLAGGSLYYHDIDVEHISGDYSYCYDWEREDGYISGVPYSAMINDSYYKSVDTFPWEIDAEKETLYYLPKVGTSPADNIEIIRDVKVNVADASLGSEVETDHDRPPIGTFVFGPNYNGTCFIIKDNLLYYSKPKQPDYWPPTYFIEVSPIQYPLYCGVFNNGQPYVSSANEIYEIQGTGHDSFFPYKTQAVTGTKSTRGLLSVYGFGLFHNGSDGLYLYGGGLDKKLTQKGFEPIFRRQDKNGVLAVNDTSNSWLLQFRNKIYFFYPDDSETYSSNVIVLDTDNNRITYYKYPVEMSAVVVEAGEERILAGDESGNILYLEDTSTTEDNTTAVDWEVQSKDFTLQTRAHFPRWVKYDVDASHVDCTATGTLYLDDVSHQTHTITGDRTTKRRLVATGNGNRASIKISGSGPVEIYAAEGE